MNDLANNETGDSKLASTALLSCPFCGDAEPKARGVQDSGKHRWVIRCDWCLVQTTPRPSKVVAAEDWNNRKREADLMETVKACVVAAGGSEDVDELERQMKGTNHPSEFVAAQMRMCERTHEARISMLESGLQRVARYWDEPTDLDSDEMAEHCVQIARETLRRFSELAR